MKRSHNVENIINSCEIINKTGFIPHVDILFGTPTETYEDRLETFELIDIITKKHRGKIHLHYFIPLPGTAWSRKKAEKIEEISVNKINKLIETGRADGEFSKQLIYSENMKLD